MVLRSILFALAAYGMTAVIAFMVAVLIKVIALVVQRADKKAAANKANS